MKEFTELMSFVCWASKGKLSTSSIPIMDILLTDGTKELLVRSCLPYGVIASILTRSVREIEEGSLETVDKLVRKKALQKLGASYF